MKHAIAMLFFFFASLSAQAKHPDCTSPEAWPASMAFSHLKNAGVLVPERIDFDKTTVVRMASSPGKKKGVYRQIHKVTFVEKRGSSIIAITDNDVSTDECSEGSVTVYQISRVLD